ncbi:hypothetical protein yc1106_07671 [Curvularia clavata]|uniref:Uncharacterized protein n=1 Tax=Curvularia clavata TaxID=95742 RepID=A0A9Q8ZC18_CURCL|nr:hypothetical protein yc1106_07671 [Curvularia clavata]
MANGIYITPDVVSQTRAHQLGQPSAVLHDEAGKTLEYGSLAALVFSRPYTKDIIIYYTTVAGDLGFTRDNARQLLANGRARSLLIMIGDHDAVSAHYTGKNRYRYRESAYYGAIQIDGFPMQDILNKFHSTINNKAAISFDPADQLEEIEHEGVSGDSHEGVSHEGVSGNDESDNVDWSQQSQGMFTTSSSGTNA